MQGRPVDDVTCSAATGGWWRRRASSARSRPARARGHYGQRAKPALRERTWEATGFPKMVRGLVGGGACGDPGVGGGPSPGPAPSGARGLAQAGSAPFGVQARAPEAVSELFLRGNRGGVEAFRRARCEGAAEVAEAPRAFLTAVVRYGPGAGLAGAAQARLCCLWAGAGAPATVLTNAVQQKRPHVPVLSTAIGRALARGHRGGEGAEGGGSGGASSHPDAPGPLAAADGAEDRRLLKRRRTLAETGDAQSSSMGAAEALGVCRRGVVASAVASWPPLSRSLGHSGEGGSRGPSGHCEPTSHRVP